MNGIGDLELRAIAVIVIITLCVEMDKLFGGKDDDQASGKLQDSGYNLEDR